MVEAMLVSWCLAQAAPLERLRFEDAVQRAVSTHPAMRVAEEDAARALAQLEQARAPSLPTLGATATFTRLDDDRRLADRLVLGKEQLSANVQVVVPLVNTPRWAQWYRASKQADAVRATTADVKRQVAVSAARAWLGVLAQQRVVKAAESSRSSARALLDFSSERLAGGIGTRLDQLRAAQELSVSTTQLQNALAGLARAQDSLGQMTGAEVPVDVVPEEPTLAPAGPVEESLESFDELRLDVRAARIRKETSDEVTRTDWLDYLPLATAIFQPFYQNPPSLTQPLTGWQLNLVLQLPLYDGGLRYGQARERRSIARAADAQLDLALRRARIEVRTAFTQVTHADLALEAARDAAKQAAEALSLANEAYRAGATTNLEVIDAERRARDAEVQQALAEDAARQARLDVLVASGRFPAP